MTGNITSSPHEPLFLLDESLTPAVADALNLVGYNFSTVYETFTDRGSLDPEIIAWCRNNGAAWIHADDRARRAHQALLQTSGIRTLLVSQERGRIWVRRPVHHRPGKRRRITTGSHRTTGEAPVLETQTYRQGTPPCVKEPAPRPGTGPSPD